MPDLERHSISLGLERIGSDFYMLLKVCGELRHADYELITPMLESAIGGIRKPVVRAVVDITELTGWELRAAWDDFRLNLEHGSAFEKIAVIGNRRWQSIAAAIGAWFVSADLKYFEDYDAAVGWLQQ